MEFVDIAGLVAGASKGEGLGNRFLSHIREVNAIVHVVRAFEDDNILHVSNHIDPASDVETINTELMLADLETVEKAILRADKNGKSGNKEQIALADLLRRLKNHLDQGNMLRSMSLSKDDKHRIKSYGFLTVKPTLYIANVSEGGFENNPHLDTLRQIAAYSLLGLQTYFTAGPKEARAWTIRVGCTAPQAAGVIHSDFERGFICAETVAYEDYIKFNGEQGSKENGRLRLEGKEYIVQDGDVVHFRFNV